MDDKKEPTNQELNALDDPRIFAVQSLKNQEKTIEVLEQMDWKLWKILKHLQKDDNE